MNRDFFIVRQPLRRKLMLIIMGTTTLGLLLAAGFFGLYERYRIRDSMVDDLTALARLIGDRSTAALLFDDAPGAKQNLAALQVKTHVVAACIYTETGVVFASFVVEGRTADFPMMPGPDGHRFGRDALTLFSPIVLDGNRIGTIHIRADLDEIKSLWRQFVWIALLVIASAGLAAYLLSSRLQRLVSEPLAEVAETARRITQQRDYSVRAINTGVEEVNILVRAFNDMLGTIEAQNLELQDNNLNLEHSERKYRELVQHANSIILHWSRDGRILFLNEFGQRFFGFTEAEILGRHVIGTIVPETDTSGRDLNAMMDKICADPSAFDQNINENMRHNGERVWVAWTNKVVLSPQGQVAEILSIGVDITARKKAEDEILQLNAQLEQRVAERTAQLAAKNQELKGFAYTVSHDLKAPLRGITGYAQELVRRHKDGLSERAQFCLGQIITASGNLDALIEDLLKYSRLDAETPTPTKVDLSDLVGRILHDRTHALTELGVEVHVDVPPLQLNIWEVGLRQVLANLIDNALKYSRRSKPPQLSITAIVAAGQYRVSVADNGIGFDMKYHDRIFGLFNRLVRADEFEGTGAGLAIVKKVLDRLGGRIWAESAPGQGATFFVEFPSQDTS